MASEFKMPELLPTSKPRKSLEEQPGLLSSSKEESVPCSTTVDSSEELSSTQEKTEIIQSSTHHKLDLSKSKEQLQQEKQAKYAEIISSLKYHPPDTVGATSADPRYSFEVLKTGTIVDRFKFSRLDNKGFYVVGRVPACDIVAENPTVSRTHAILQFITCPPEKKGGPGSKVGNGEAGVPDRTGLYLFDLNSTHGTFINKNQIFPCRYYRLHVGHILKFGNSTRLYVLLGPSEDEEEESDKSVTELQTERLQKELARKKLEEQGLLIKGPDDGTDEDGCAWGMGEDAVEESDMRENPFAINFEQSESFDNPKKTLRGWFEREGYDLVYDCREKAPGQFICRINLPVDGPAGQPVFAEVDIKGKKKEAVHQSALQACQILDKYGVLRVSHTESKTKRKGKDWEDKDYYSSDEDTFLDRTGSVEKKREKRMKIAGKIEDTVETFQSLSAKANAIQSEIDSLQSQITKAQNVNTGNDDVDIDDYVKFLKTGATDVKKLKSKLREANDELKKVTKLLNIAKPASLPENLIGDKKSEVTMDVQQEITPKSGNSASENKTQIKFNLSKPSAIPASRIDDPELEPLDRNSRVVPDSTSSPNMDDKNKNKRQLAVSGPRLPTLDGNKDALKISPSKVSTKSKETIPFPKDMEETLDPQDLTNPIVKSLDQNSDSSDDEEDNATSSYANLPKKNKRPRIRQKIKKEIKYDYDESDPKYSTWVPPTNQRGDGKTALNEKLGY